MFNSITFANANISSSLTLLDILKCSLSKYKKTKQSARSICRLCSFHSLYAIWYISCKDYIHIRAGYY